MTDCLEWIGNRDRFGYGYVWHEGRTWFVHRLVWTQVNGPIPEGGGVLHRCDNPPCFDLAHLYLGTPADNARDRSERGRHHNQVKTHCPKGHPYDQVNTYADSNGKRHCRACGRVASERYKERSK